MGNKNTGEYQEKHHEWDIMDLGLPLKAYPRLENISNQQCDCIISLKKKTRLHLSKVIWKFEFLLQI